MVELQLEKLSPMPVAQIVWAIHILSTAPSQRRNEAETEEPAVELQNIVVAIAARGVVEEYWVGRRTRLSRRPAGNAVAGSVGGRAGGRRQRVDLRRHARKGFRARGMVERRRAAELELYYLPRGDGAKSLKNQLVQFLWAGEMEGWLAEPSRWHLVADPVNAAEWEDVPRRDGRAAGGDAAAAAGGTGREGRRVAPPPRRPARRSCRRIFPRATISHSGGPPLACTGWFRRAFYTR